MNKQLLKALPELVNANVISEETAQKIIRYYETKQQHTPNTLTLVLGILGALLVSCGLLLIIAHNWNELSRTVKTILSFIPLLAGQVACAYTLLKQQKSSAWKQGSSILLFSAIGASIALVSQVYQVNGSLSGFLLTWMLLALPLIYLLSAHTVALLCLAGITWYACAEGYFNSQAQIPYMYAVMLLLIFPYYYRLFTTNPQSNYLTWFNLFIAVSVTISLGSFINVPGGWYQWVFLLYCILFCIYFFIGRSAFFHGKRLGANPYSIIGLAGILGILLTISFTSFWQHAEASKLSGILNDPLPYLLATGLIVAFILAFKDIQRHAGKLPDPSGFSFAWFGLLLLLPHSYASIAAFMVNAWIITIAVYFIHKGSAEDHLGIVNFGLLIIAALAICRFFDDTIPFIWRGIFFVITGAGFFIANYLILQKRKHLKKL